MPATSVAAAEAAGQCGTQRPSPGARPSPARMSPPIRKCWRRRLQLRSAAITLSHMKLVAPVDGVMASAPSRSASALPPASR